MGDLNVNTERVYSVDKKLWLNMSREEAYAQGKETLALFNYADVDNNLEISEDEMNRYNSPVIVENYEEVDKSKIITQGQIVGLFKTMPINLESYRVTSQEEEFYAGLEQNKVSKKGIDIFYAIDSNHDGVLSREEMQIAADIKSKAKQAKNELLQKENKRINTAANASVISGGCLGIIGGIAFSLFEGVGIGEGAILATAALGVVGTLVGVLAGVVVCDIVKSLMPGRLAKKKDEAFDNALGDLTSEQYAEFARKQYTKELLEQQQ